MTQFARFSALLILALALASLRLQYDALAFMMGQAPVQQVLWVQFGYFGPLSMVFLALVLIAISQKRKPAESLFLCAMLSVATASLMPLPLSPQALGQTLWAERLLRAALPLASLGWWRAYRRTCLSLDPPTTQGIFNSKGPKLLLWPLLYLVYMLIRGNLTGLWPARDASRMTQASDSLTGFALMALAYLCTSALLLRLTRRR